MLERVVVLARTDEIEEATVDFVLVTEAQGQALELPEAPALRTSEKPGADFYAGESAIRAYRPVQAGERARIEAAIETHGGNKSRAAQALNLTLRQLNYRLKVL